MSILFNYGITAQSGKYHTVRFLDHDETVLSTQLIPNGSNAIAPSNPTRQYYIFTGWSEPTTNITDDIDIEAEYKKELAWVYKDDSTSAGDGDWALVDTESRTECLTQQVVKSSLDGNRNVNTYQGGFAEGFVMRVTHNYWSGLQYLACSTFRYTATWTGA